jgi:peptidoglycan/xylan/chitin deacetylase (PgdA/CDA1 family)
MTQQHKITVLGFLVIGVSVLIGYGLVAGSRSIDMRASPNTPLAATTTTTVPSAVPNTGSATTTNANHTSVRVPIVVYHGIRDTLPSDTASTRQFNLSPSIFKQQLTYLKDHGFTAITFDDLTAYFDRGTALPPKPIILSFDDGWYSQTESALPELTQNGIIATFYLYPNVIGHEHYMTWDNAHALVAAGMTIGSHSKSHQYMTTQDPSKLDVEVAGSKRILEEKLGVHITSFAYPFGLSDDHIRTMVQAAGYTTARALEHGTMQDSDHRYILKSYLARNDLKDFVYFVEQLQ